MLENLAREYATKADRPIGTHVEIVEVAGQKIPVPVDGMTQMASREYFRGMRHAMLMIRDAVPKIAELAEELVKEARYKVAMEESNGNQEVN